MKQITKFKIQLVKESNSNYNLDSKKVSSPLDFYKIINEITDLQYETEEVLVLITLDSKNTITGYFEVSRGNINMTICSPREIFKRAILNNATSIILTHNHPSGNVSPSEADIDSTKRIKLSGELLGIELLDHIIIGNGFYSMKSNEII